VCRATSEGESSAAPLRHAQEIRFKSVGLNAVVGSHSAPKMARRGSSCRPFLAHSALRSNQVAELQGLALSDLDRSNKSCGLIVVSGLDTRGPHRLRTRRRAGYPARSDPAGSSESEGILHFSGNLGVCQAETQATRFILY